MERAEWLAERRAAVVAVYDAESEAYDENEYPTTSHGRFVARLLETCPPGGVVLDAPCGTGKYFATVIGSGRRVVGIDQSAGMLAQAEAKGLAEALIHIELTDMTFDASFDGAMTIDALENVSPEDWPRVLANLHRAVRPGGHLYLTIEEIDSAEVDAAFAELTAAGLPAVRGEVIEGDVAGYHYYPGRDQVARWLEAEGLVVVEEAFDQEDGWGYRHLLLGQR
jgi:ubiquinone/menaquinone biosynthesis C-methylase UbiE